MALSSSAYEEWPLYLDADERNLMGINAIRRRLLSSGGERLGHLVKYLSLFAFY